MQARGVNLHSGVRGGLDAERKRKRGTATSFSFAFAGLRLQPAGAVPENGFHFYSPFTCSFAFAGLLLQPAGAAPGRGRVGS